MHAEEFGVAVERYEAWSGVVECPRCGSIDLVLLVFGRVSVAAAER